MSHKTLFSRRVDRLQGSALRSIFNAIESGEVISFAGGLPSEDSFPSFDSAITGSAANYLQYGSSAGEWELRKLIAANLAKTGLVVDAEQVLVLSGSQQGIDLVAKLFIDEGTPVAIESPTYLAALQVFDFFGASYSSYAPGDVQALSALQDQQLLYINPTFQNPSCYVYSDQQRRATAAFCDTNNTVLFEDDPYRALSYNDVDRRPCCAYLKSAAWIYQSTFSKTLCPGLRIGYLVCSPELIDPLLHLKQAADLHTNRLAQGLVIQALQQPNAEQRMLSLVEHYRIKRDHFNAYLEQHFSDLAHWISPSGGLFFWLRLKSESAIDLSELLQISLQAGVAFMPGDSFFVNRDTDGQYLRLNFSHVSESQAAIGLQRLSELLRAHSNR